MSKFHSSLARISLILLSFSACSPNTTVQYSDPPVATRLSPTETVAPVSRQATLYRAPEVPSLLVAESEKWGLQIENDPSQASLWLQLENREETLPVESRTNWIYTVVTAFPTTLDGVTGADLQDAWRASKHGSLADWHVFMDASTAAAMHSLWGEPTPGVLQIVPSDELVESLWSERPAWGIVPFEALEPKLKVLMVDSQSPIHKDFTVANYPLQVKYALRVSGDVPDPDTFKLPPSNREPARMTSVILSGVTALVRATAFTMETKGVTYPASDIREFMRMADITHISNEIPFYTGCDFPNPSRSKLVFCSDPKYIDLLTNVGTDVVELTGNHFADYGAGAMLETLDIYAQQGIGYYGGGADLEDALKPLLLKHNGNKISFIGCNPVDWGKPPIATENKPGAAPCDPDYLEKTIADLKSQGYLVIATFQHQEYYSPEARPDQIQDFHLVANAGASIVSGSQAHFAQVMEFYSDAFIHYGLGHLFFDQMGDIPYHPGIRREFIDRYLIYDGKLMSVELMTMMLEDYARPRPMTAAERASFLSEYFAYSGWVPYADTPTPQPTLTLTPMSLPKPFQTLEPSP